MVDAVIMNTDTAAPTEHCAEEEDDHPKRRLIDPEEGHYVLDSYFFPLLSVDAPLWRLKRTRPAFLSIGILASITACLTTCALFVPDLVRELHQPFSHQYHIAPYQLTGSQHIFSRLLNSHTDCIAVGNSSSPSKDGSSLKFHCAFHALSPDACGDFPTLCRYRVALLACQVITPTCIFACLCLLALAVCVFRHCGVRRRLLLAAVALACFGLVSTVAFVACLHSFVSAMSAMGVNAPASYSNQRYYYSANSIGTRIVYASLCLQALLTCQLACLPICLHRVALERATMLALITPVGK